MVLSVVIPMFNESETVENCIERLDGVLSSKFSNNDYEIILVNDGSTDNTMEIASSKIAAGYKNIILTGYNTNAGKGKAVKFGVEAARGDYIVYTDCDLSLIHI